MPERHRLHWPQPEWISTATRSPTLYSSTPGPSAATVPIYSWPGVNPWLKGNVPLITAGGPLAITSRSVAQMATASMRMSTSDRSGTGISFCPRLNSLGFPSVHANICFASGAAAFRGLFNSSTKVLSTEQLPSNRQRANMPGTTISDCPYNHYRYIGPYLQPYPAFKQHFRPP